MTAVSASIEECKAARAAATAKVRAFGRTVRRFAKAGDRDDGTPRCIACGQIDEAPWHKPWLCFGMISQSTPARAEAQDETAVGEWQDTFMGDDVALIASIKALLDLPDSALSQRIPGLAKQLLLSAATRLAHPSPTPAATVCNACGDKGYVEHEGGDGEGWPSKPEIEACPRCDPHIAADDPRVRIAVQKLESIRLMRSDRPSGPYPKSYKGGFDAASDLMSGWATEALAALKSTAAKEKRA